MIQKTCQICNRSGREIPLTPAAVLRPALVDTIRRTKPDWNPDGFICKDDLAEFRSAHISRVLEEEVGEVSALESSVIKSLREQDILVVETNPADDKKTFGEWLSDKIAAIGGSWAFISCFFFLLSAWMFVNSSKFTDHPFDAYPFILLNLILSCLAAVQAPIIMMSQNRQEAKDRLRAENDYRINLKAELEIQHLHEKIDHLLIHQWQRLLEVHQTQVELGSTIHD